MLIIPEYLIPITKLNHFQITGNLDNKIYNISAYKNKQGTVIFDRARTYVKIRMLENNNEQILFY